VKSLQSAAISAVFLALLFGSCSGGKKAPQATAAAKPSSATGKVFAVTADSAAFFRHGPQPGRDPDQTLPRDTLVKVIRPSFGYSKVELVSSGQQGYVLSEEIKPASPHLIAATSAPAENSVAAVPSATPAGEEFNLNSSDPRLVPPPEDLPNPDLPQAAPSPGE
jgi:hypothetical protein